MTSEGKGGGKEERSREVEDQLSKIRSQRLRSRAFTVGTLVVVVVLTYLGMGFVGFELGQLYGQLGTFWASLGDFTSPNFRFFSVYSKENGITGWAGLYESLLSPGTVPESILQSDDQILLRAILVTLVVGFVGTVLGFPLALLFGVLGSERVVPFPLNFVFRGTMSTIRSIPALVWILIYVPLAGISPVSAVLAIATDTVGNLGRLFTDELEEVEDGPIEAIDSTGASKPQSVVFGMLSQVSNSFIAWTLYILEINVRIAISLGVLGAGGIGRYIQLQINLVEYGRASAGILMVVVVVVSVEMVSSRVRARLRPGEHEGEGLLDAIKNLADTDRWIGA